MHKIRCFVFGFAFFLGAIQSAAIPASGADPTPADENERQLIAVLQSDAPTPDKAITCKRLAIYGTGKAVPALAPLLADPELASWARIALEAIPDEAADEALRDALVKLEGRLLVGVVNSIAVRGDAKAVDLLAQRLNGSDVEAAAAAAVALGHIATVSATATLQQSLADAPAEIRSAIAEGCVRCAEKLLAQGKTHDAASLYDKVRESDVPKPRVIEATRGAILARKSAGIPLLVEQLQSADKALFAIGLSTARELDVPQVTGALVAELGQATPARQARLLLLLADRGDREALPAVLQAAHSGPTHVRIAAISVLQSLGDAACVPALLKLAMQADAECASAAKAALEGLPGDDVDAALSTSLANAEGNQRRLVIELVGLRRIDARPALLEAADDADAPIRSAALVALGSVVDLDGLSILISRVVAPKKPEDTEAATQALHAACVRLPDGEACAAKLVAAMAAAPVSAKCTVLEVLGAMGGTTALKAIGDAGKTANPQLQDTASRLLGQWMTVDAAPVLLELATMTADDKYKIRALRGYIRIARQFDVPAQQRAEMCRRALQAAERDTEKKLVLEVLQRYPSIDMLKLAVEVAKVPALKSDATGVSLAIVQKIGGKSVDVPKLLAQIGHDPVKVEIMKAEYGAGDKVKDVTETLRRHVRVLPLIVLRSSSYNASFGGDPAPGVPKQLKVQYRMDGQAAEVSFGENAPILLPTPEE